jgi:hypothetical protein
MCGLIAGSKQILCNMLAHAARHHTDPEQLAWAFTPADVALWMPSFKTMKWLPKSGDKTASVALVTHLMACGLVAELPLVELLHRVDERACVPAADACAEAVVRALPPGAASDMTVAVPLSREPDQTLMVELAARGFMRTLQALTAAGARAQPAPDGTPPLVALLSLRRFVEGRLLPAFALADDSVRALVQAGADVNAACAADGMTAMHMWALWHSPTPAVFTALLQAGANPDAYCRAGLTPLGVLETAPGPPRLAPTLVRAVTRVPSKRLDTLPRAAEPLFALPAPITKMLACGDSDQVRACDSPCVCLSLRLVYGSRSWRIWWRCACTGRAGL